MKGSLIMSMTSKQQIKGKPRIEVVESLEEFISKYYVSSVISHAITKNLIQQQHITQGYIFW